MLTGPTKRTETGCMPTKPDEIKTPRSPHNPLSSGCLPRNHLSLHDEVARPSTLTGEVTTDLSERETKAAALIHALDKWRAVSLFATFGIMPFIETVSYALPAAVTTSVMYLACIVAKFGLELGFFTTWKKPASPNGNSLKTLEVDKSGE